VPAATVTFSGIGALQASAARVTTYFQVTNAACLAMLPPDLRTSVDLAFLATEAEFDVLSFYTKPINRVTYLNYPAPAQLPVALRLTSVFTDLGNGNGVFLLNYTIDPTQCTDPGLVTAIRRTVAEVIRWRYPQLKRDVQVKQRSAPSGTSVSGSTTWIDFDQLPPGWNRWLRLWDTRENAWGV